MACRCGLILAVRPSESACRACQNRPILSGAHRPLTGQGQLCHGRPSFCNHPFCEAGCVLRLGKWACGVHDLGVVQRDGIEMPVSRLVRLFCWGGIRSELLIGPAWECRSPPSQRSIPSTSPAWSAHHSPGKPSFNCCLNRTAASPLPPDPAHRSAALIESPASQPGPSSAACGSSISPPVAHGAEPDLPPEQQNPMITPYPKTRFPKIGAGGGSRVWAQTPAPRRHGRMNGRGNQQSWRAGRDD